MKLSLIFQVANEIFIKTAVSSRFNKISALLERRYCISPTCWFHSRAANYISSTVQQTTVGGLPLHSFLCHVLLECPAIIAVLFYICNNRISAFAERLDSQYGAQMPSRLAPQRVALHSLNLAVL